MPRKFKDNPIKFLLFQLIPVKFITIN